MVEQIVSADGVARDPDGGMSFVTEDAGRAEQDTEQLRMLEGVDAVVLGRVTYEMFAGYWPGTTVDQEAVAGPINSLPKHVVTATLERAPWGGHAPAQVERGDGVEVVRRLRRSYARDLVVWGSLTLVDALLTAGEVDVLRLRVVPTLSGAGRGVAPVALGVRPMVLTGCHQHPGGQVTLQYDLSRRP